MHLPFVWRLRVDFTFFGRRNGNLSAEEAFEGSALSCLLLLDSRLKTPFRCFEGEPGGLGAGNGTSGGLFSPSSLGRGSDTLGCFSRIGDTTSEDEGPASSTG